MRFIKLTIAYHGGGYAGWQVQANDRSVQGVLESAWEKVSNERLRITASGRTDSGVHALGQVCSLQTGCSLKPSVLVKALNASLPEDVRVLQVDEAPTNFHAIRDATGKTYRYVLQVGSQASVFHHDRSWFIARHLNVPSMKRSARFLIGKHDFSSFQAAGSERLTSVRTIHELEIRERHEESVRFVDVEVSADGFLYNMVRNIVGTLVQVGLEKQAPEHIEWILAQRNRAAAGPTAPAQGLFLVSVRYD